MKKIVERFIIIACLVLSLCGVPPAGTGGRVSAAAGFPPRLSPTLSASGKALYHGLPALVILPDPNPAARGLRDQGVAALTAQAGGSAAVSTFVVTFETAGTPDPWGAICQAFPSAARTAFNAAVATWSRLLRSSVPIKVQVCWADLGSAVVLGYSGDEPQYRAFPNAPDPNAWYNSALANSLAGFDLGPGSYDDNITFNSHFAWYLGTDGRPPLDEYDLVSVSTHELGHGMNFGGMAGYSGSSGSFGYDGSPQIYDTFMEDAAGNPMTGYSNPSPALGSLLTSNSLWFHGPNSYRANGSQRVKIYAPSIWMDGSSYSHMDYDAFVGTPDALMVYAIGAGTSRHAVGPVTTGMFEDMGWKIGVVPTPLSPSGSIDVTRPAFQWSKVSGASQYAYAVYQGNRLVSADSVYPYACGSTTCSASLPKDLASGEYSWRVKASEGSGWTEYSAPLGFRVSAPFNSAFSSGASGWIPVKGKWTVSAGDYRGTGALDTFASSYHAGVYDTYTYAVRLKQTGCTACPWAILFNGDPSSLDATGFWKDGYAFEATDDGSYSVWEAAGGTETNLSSWIFAPGLLTPAWNTLAVTYNSSTHYAQFFINHIEVADDTLSDFPAGSVGVGFTSAAIPGARLFVDYASLTAGAPASQVAAGLRSARLVHLGDQPAPSR
ncbi:MAG: hypothetical protein WCE68_11220 [Anaerolineales bacterium]